MNLECVVKHTPRGAQRLSTARPDLICGPVRRPDATSATRRTTTSVFWSQLDPRGGRRTGGVPHSTPLRCTLHELRLGHVNMNSKPSCAPSVGPCAGR